MELFRHFATSMEGRRASSRLLAVCRHLLTSLDGLHVPEQAVPPPLVAPSLVSAASPQPLLRQDVATQQCHREDLIDEFSTRGLVVLAPSALGVPAEIHETIYARRLSSSSNLVNSIPEIIEVLNAPGVVAALNLLAGRDYAIVPFCHAFFASAGTDQCWHKDDNVRRVLSPST